MFAADAVGYGESTGMRVDVVTGRDPAGAESVRRKRMCGYDASVLGCRCWKPGLDDEGLWDEETHRHRRAGTRHDNFDCEDLLGSIRKALRNESPVDLSRSESLDNHHGCLTDGT